MLKFISGVIKLPLCVVLAVAGFFIAVNFLPASVAADTVDYTVNVASSLNISISGDIDNAGKVVLDLNPINKTSDSKNITVKVGTNNITGYKLVMSSANDETRLLEASDNTRFIPSLASGDATGTTADALKDNTWGYRKDNTGDFIPFVSGTQLLENDEGTNEDSTALSFASKINYAQTAGSYKIDLNFTATANPVYPFIQNLDPSLCVTDTQTTVLDKRDLQQYLVQRLADGNCWMLDNLRLDLTNAKVQSKLNSLTTNASDELLEYLKNGGGTSPNPASGVSNAWVNSDNLPYIYTDFKDNIANTTYGVGSGKVGVIYNFCAASAASYCVAGAGTTGDITSDVCPIGWKVPASSGNGSYAYLYTKYSNNTTTFRTALSLNYASVFYNNPSTYLATKSGAFMTTTHLIGNYGSKYTFRPFYIDGTYTMNNDMYREYGYPIRCILK